MNEIKETPFSNDLELFEKLPAHTPLNVEELGKVARAKFGLRSTNPSHVEAEINAGVIGDYILLSDFSHFVDVDDTALDDFIVKMGGIHQEGSLQKSLFRDILAQGVVAGNLPSKYQDVLTQVDITTVSKRYEMALRQFLLKKAIPAVPYQITPDMSVSQYLNDLVGKASPVILFVKASDSSGYDYDNYFGFGKNGRNFIPPHKFISRTGLTIQDVELLKKRYQKYLGEKVANLGLSKAQPEMRIGQIIDRDVGELLLAKTITIVRSLISDSTPSK
jgi:hypothetical protein